MVPFERLSDLSDGIFFLHILGVNVPHPQPWNAISNILTGYFLKFLSKNSWKEFKLMTLLRLFWSKLRLR